MLEFDPEMISQASVMDIIAKAQKETQSFDKPVQCRKLRLPIVFDHPVIKESEVRYSKLTRSKAVYLPDSIKYVHENNGLPERDSVFDVLRNTRFIVVGVGFITGLPLMLPIDPRARIVAQKYNPPRTTTPPGTVGIGGRIFCIYPADQPGGYMPLARTIPVWDTFSLRKGFTKGQPWLCEPFDIITFYEVGVSEFDEIEKSFQAGTYEIQMEPASFDVTAELAQEKEILGLPETASFQARQNASAAEMSAREAGLYAQWQAGIERPEAQVEEDEDLTGIKVISPHQGKVWKVLVEPGDRISAGQAIAILESMKMEIPVLAGDDHEGLVVRKVLAREETLVLPGNTVALLEAAE